MQQPSSSISATSSEQQQKLSTQQQPSSSGRTGTVRDMTARNVRVKFPSNAPGSFQMYTPYFTSSVHPFRDDPSAVSNFAIFEKEKHLREEQMKLENEQKQLVSSSIVQSPRFQELLQNSFLFIEYHLFQSTILSFSISSYTALQTIFYDLQKKSLLHLQIQFVQMLYQFYLSQLPEWKQKCSIVLLQQMAFLNSIASAPLFALHDCWKTGEFVTHILYNGTPLSVFEQEQSIHHLTLPLENPGELSLTLPHSDQESKLISLVPYSAKIEMDEIELTVDGEQQQQLIFTCKQKNLIQDKRLVCWVNHLSLVPWHQINVSPIDNKNVQMSVSLSFLRRIPQYSKENKSHLFTVIDALTGQIFFEKPIDVLSFGKSTTPQNIENRSDNGSIEYALLHLIKDCYQMNLISISSYLRFHSLSLYLYQTYCQESQQTEDLDAFQSNLFFWALFSRNQPLAEVLQIQSGTDIPIHEPLYQLFDTDEDSLRDLDDVKKERDELFVQVQSNNIDVVNDLLAQEGEQSLQQDLHNYLQYTDPQYGNSCFHHAIQNTNADMLRLLIDSAKQANLSISHLLYQINKNSQTPLQLACSMGQFTIVQMCLAELAEETEEEDSFKNVIYYSPLACAILGQHIKVVKLLLDHFKKNGVNMVNQKVGPLQWNSLHLGCKMGNIEIAKLLIAKQVEPFALDAQGKQPYEYVVENRQQFTLLFDSLQNTNHIKISEKPMLQFVSTYGKEEQLKIMMKAFKTVHFKWNVPVECYTLPEKYDISVRIPIVMEWNENTFVEESRLFFGLLHKQETEEQWTLCPKAVIVVEKIKSVTFLLDVKCIEYRISFKEECANNKNYRFKLEIRYDTSPEYHILEAQGISAASREVEEEDDEEAMIMDEEDEPSRNGENWNTTKPRLLFASSEFKLLKKTATAVGEENSLKRTSLPADPTVERPTKQRG